MTIPIIIPLGKGYEIPKIDCCNGFFYTVIVNDTSLSDKKRIRIAETKNKCVEVAKKLGEDFTIIHDSDMYVEDIKTFFKMKDFLIENPNHAACSLLRRTMIWNEYPNHVCASILMVRKEALKDMNYGPGHEIRTSCETLAENFHLTGWKYSYLSKESLIQQIE